MLRHQNPFVIREQGEDFDTQEDASLLSKTFIKRAYFEDTEWLVRSLWVICSRRKSGLRKSSQQEAIEKIGRRPSLQPPACLGI